MPEVTSHERAELEFFLPIYSKLWLLSLRRASDVSPVNKPGIDSRLKKVFFLSGSEKKIDRIERQLDSVICALQSLQSQIRASTAGGSKLPEAAPPISSASSASNASISGTTDPVVEGGSSLTAQSVFANNFLQRVVTKDSAPAMQKRLDDLDHVVEAMQKQPASHEMTYPNAKPIKPVSLDGCELPPIEKTLQVLKLTQRKPPVPIPCGPRSCIPLTCCLKVRRDFCLAWVYELFTINRFPETIESCLNIYVAENPSIFAFITVNVVLYYLFSAHASEVLETRDEYLGWSKVCAVNVETALASLPLHLPATKQAIIALLLGVGPSRPLYASASLLTFSI